MQCKITGETFPSLVKQLKIGFSSLKAILEWSEPIIKRSYFVSENTIPKNSRYVVHNFCSIVVKTRELYEVVSGFHLSIFSNRMQPLPTKEKSTAIKNGWCVLGSVRVTSFVIDDLILLKQCLQFIFPVNFNNIIKQTIHRLQFNMKFVNKLGMEVHGANEPHQFSFCNWRRNFLNCSSFGMISFICMKPNFVTKILNGEKHEKQFSWS